VTGIVMATMLEAGPFIRGMGLAEIPGGPFPVYRGADAILAVSGIGKVNAAMAVAYLACAHSLSLVLNLGAAGCTRAGFSVGEIYHIDRVIEHDRPHLITKKERMTAPAVMEGFPLASLATGDMPVTGAAERGALARLADLVDMEGAAVVQACARFGLPVYLFKVVTDTPDHEKDADIIRNVKKTSSALFDFYADKIRPRLA